MSNVERLEQLLKKFEYELKSLKRMQSIRKLGTRDKDRVLGDLAAVVYDLERISERYDGYELILTRLYNLRDQIGSFAPNVGNTPRKAAPKRNPGARMSSAGGSNVNTSGSGHKSRRLGAPNVYIRVYLGGSPGLGKRS